LDNILFNFPNGTYYDSSPLEMLGTKFRTRHAPTTLYALFCMFMQNNEGLLKKKERVRIKSKNE